MGYVVKRLKCKNRTWKVQFQIYEGSKRTVKDVREDSYRDLGLSKELDYEQVKQICKNINAMDKIQKKNEKLNRIKERISEEDIKLNALFPSVYIAEFETKHVKNRHKYDSIWRAAKRCIVKLSIDFPHWNFYQEEFYRHFVETKFSYSYVQKLIHVINLWGKFISYKQQKFFSPIDFPKGIYKERIVDTNYEHKGSLASEPLTPEELESKASCFSRDQYNWLYLSVWLGLRPSEIDGLKKNMWRYEDNVLWVYQSKLTSLPKPKRFKPIPLKHQEQLVCMDIIRSREFDRPLAKTLQKYFNKNVTCYGGRKGFMDLMLSKGNSLEAISQWLGHTSIDRSWRNYKDKKQVLL